MKQKTYKLDIFKVLGQISKKDTGFYDELSETEQKALAPFVVMRWLTGTESAKQIYFINELVNPFAFEFVGQKTTREGSRDHKKLLIFLMTICCSGNTQRYKWKKTHKHQQTKALAVIRDYFNYSTPHAKDALPLLSNEQIIQYGDDLGYQSGEMKDLKNELKTRKR